MALVYTKHMTPKWLNNYRNEFIDWNVDGIREKDTVLEIPGDNSDFERIVTIDLIDTDVTARTDVMVFKIRASLEHVSPLIEPRVRQPRIRDPLSIMISDGDRAVGVQIQDPEDYHTIGPYVGIEGDAGSILTNITRHDSQMKDSDKVPDSERRRWPQVFDIIIRVSNKRRETECSASCYSAVRGGLAITSAFSNPLNARGPWSLELYRGEREETYNINYLDVQVFTEDDFIDQRW